MDSPLPRVSVIVPVHGGGEPFAAALGALAASTYPNRELIVVDDGSPDESIQLARDAGAHVIQTEHAGPAAARNRAADVATGDILFFTDADVTVAPDTIALGVRVLMENPSVAAVFGSYTAEAGGDRGFFTRYKNYVHSYTHQRAEREAFTFWTGCGFVRRDVFGALGGFDAGQKFLSDVEFGYRMHLAGHTVWVEKAIQVVHHKSYSFGGLLRSDFFGRAIPWSRIMMKHRTVKSDLNLRPANVASVPVAGAALLFLLIGVVYPWAWLATIGLLIALALLNAPLLAFIGGRAGWGFAVGAFFTHALIYVLSGVGVVAATFGARSGGR